MKFYCENYFLSKVNEQDCTFVCPVQFIPRGKKYKTRYSTGQPHLKKSPWGTGWIFEADESFQSWCVIAYGFSPIALTESEYNLLMLDGIVFFDESREDFRIIA